MLRHTRCLVVIATVLTTVLLPAAVSGARTGSTSGPALTGPSGVYVGQTYTVYGSGFAPGSWVPLEIAEAYGCCLADGMVADASGGFSITRLAWAAGPYRVRAAVPRNGNGRWRTAASWSFEAYP
jgi:hypothetical protein